MRIIEFEIDPETVRAYLVSRHAALGFDFPPHEHKVFRVILDTCDASRLWLWQDTDGRRKVSVTEANKWTAPANERIRRVTCGDTAAGWKPLDLLKSAGFELVLASTSIDSDCLNILDGNHRAIAHWLTKGDFDGIHAYLCVHPKIAPWKSAASS